MDQLFLRLRNEAKRDPKTIVFPEADDPRILKAVKYIEKEGIACPRLLTPDLIDPAKQKEFADFFYERKKAKGVEIEEAEKLMENPLYYGAMMTRLGYADGFVAGAEFKSSSVIKAAIKCLELDSEAGMLTSCFIIVIPECSYGERGVFVYADCAVVPCPSSTQLARTAILSAQFAEKILHFKPRVAFLSFSTKGSAGGGWVDRIREALAIVREKDSGLLADGELQADAALLPHIAKKKLADSQVAGKANVLIFPNLDAGNICYKLTQRLAKAHAVGPIFLGTVQPCSDLSRGCEVEDIIDSTAVTVIGAQVKSAMKGRNTSSVEGPRSLKGE